MEFQTRREVLGGVAIALTSGCISDSESHVEIQEIEIVNMRNEPVEVTVLGKNESNDVLYENSYEFDPIQGGSTDGVNLNSDWLRTEGEVVITISANTIDERAISTADLSQDYDSSTCVSVFCTIDTNGLNIYYSEQDC